MLVSKEALRHHYTVERELADRLRNAPAAKRVNLYTEVYDELMRRVPQHPQLLARSTPGWCERRERSVGMQLAMLARFVTPETVFLEIGAGDCALSRRIARSVERVHAVDVTDSVVGKEPFPLNMTLALSLDGIQMPVAAGSIDVAFSNQLMEHLHPEDAEAQLRAICGALKPGGVYFCITPNRLYGPCDVSQHFDDVATGLHLREYSARELRALALAAGFSRVRFYAGGRGRMVQVPYAAVAAFESLLESLPSRLRKRLAGSAPARALLGLRVAAVK
jgi:2-polyprenyl-3-methyl-5-hydroxy-6-metoxy-1,4-benzoquinol methylase